MQNHFKIISTFNRPVNTQKNSLLGEKNNSTEPFPGMNNNDGQS